MSLSRGPATDDKGIPVIDPTINVKEAQASAITRLDDLREMESKHLREIMNLRADFNDKLRVAESARLDSIRDVDRDTVARAADVQTQQATTLAATVATSADAVRVTLATTVAPILEAIAALQRAQYETAGGKTQQVESHDSSRTWIGIIIAGSVGFLTIVMAIVAVAVTVLLSK